MKTKFMPVWPTLVLATTVADYFADNVVRQDYLITRATKT